METGNSILCLAAWHQCSPPSLLYDGGKAAKETFEKSFGGKKNQQHPLQGKP